MSYADPDHPCVNPDGNILVMQSVCVANQSRRTREMIWLSVSMAQDWTAQPEPHEPRQQSEPRQPWAQTSTTPPKRRVRSYECALIEDKL